MKNLKPLLFGVAFLATLSIVLNLYSFSNSPEDKTARQQIDHGHIQGSSDENHDNRRAFIRDNYKVFSIPLPEEMDFAGEKIPLEDIDIKERLDKELIVNTYWHSQTFLFHKRANRWFPIIEPILKENGVPEDFKYLAVIESGLDNVVSPANAVGFWQFLKSTGRSYGLEINDYVDERYDAAKATEAACKYLKVAYKQFGNWTLAAASYNMGMAGLKHRLDEQAVNQYYDLLLNSETSRYVFRIMAAKHILTHSQDYGFNLIDSDLYEPYEIRTVEVTEPIDNLATFAKENGSNYKILKLLNPWLRAKKLPNSSGKTYTIALPAENANLKPVEQY